MKRLAIEHGWPPSHVDLLLRANLGGGKQGARGLAGVAAHPRARRRGVAGKPAACTACTQGPDVLQPVRRCFRDWRAWPSRTGRRPSSP